MSALHFSPVIKPLCACVLAALAGLPVFASAAEVEQLKEIKVLGTAQEELKQAPGVSIISKKDIETSPPANDLADIIRKQPGVNLTGNSGSGARGNNRQIDIRGMGPENTLILIDGKPVSSRNSVRYGWRGDRDTRGDTNWVPPEQVERVEVLRGPAAARYGSGAAGGVVNIITKPATDEHHGSVTIYGNLPEHSAEGATQRMNFGLSGPLSDKLSYRLYGNIAKTDSDDVDINAGHVIGTNRAVAGREGVRNKDINGLLSWKVAPGQTVDFEAGFSRQGNIYTDDSMNNVGGALDAIRLPWVGDETNRLYRETYSVTHRGKWDSGASSLSYLQYEETRNARLNEGLAGGPEGSILAGGVFNTIQLRNLTAHSEVSLPINTRMDQMVTIGAEWTEQKLNDPTSNTQTTTEAGSIPGVSDTDRATRASSRIASVFIEDNIELRPGSILTPGLRFDHQSVTGSNWSPALNFSQALTDTLTLKAGIARAYKAPNLYQTNPNYVLYSRGTGCWGGGGSCYLVGNEDLKPETSVNKELGIEFRDGGWVAGITWFRNDYKNKVEAGRIAVDQATGGSSSAYANADVFRWSNIPKAVVEGLEGTLAVPLHQDLTWSTNFTYMLQSKDKSTGEPLSIIPEYTVNSTLDWQVTTPLSLQATLTWFGRQEPPKYDYQGVLVTGDATRSISPYALVGVSGRYVFNKRLSMNLGVSNIGDKRLFREGNAREAGAYTYNQPGRTYYASLTASY